MAPGLATMLRKGIAGTPLYPRDIWTSWLFNKFATFILPDGRKMFPVTSRNEVSNGLDAISQNENDLLIRGPDYWQSMPISQVASNGISVCVITNDIVGSLNNSGTQKVHLNAIVYDPNDWFEVGPSILKPTRAGWYLALGMLRTYTVGPYVLGIMKNGVHYAWGSADSTQQMVGLNMMQFVDLNGTTDEVALDCFCVTPELYAAGHGSAFLALIGPF